MRPNIGNVNSLGMHDKERNMDKAPNTFRIILLGDSVARMSFLAESMEQLLQKENKNIIEVWNCAVVGYNTIQECKVLEEKWLNYNPDMVIIGFCSNDFETTPIVTKINGSLTGFFPNNVNIKINPILLKYSAIYRLITKLIFSYEKQKFDRDEIIKNLATYYFKNTKKILEARRIPLVLVILPRPVTLTENTNEPNFLKIKEIADKTQINILDLSTSFEKYDPYDLRLSFDDNYHLNKKGGEIIAQKIVDYLDKKSYW